MLSAPSTPQRSFEFGPELLQFGGTDVAHRRDSEPRPPAAPDAEALKLRLDFSFSVTPRCLGDEDIDNMSAPFIDERRDRPCIDVVEAATE